MACLITKNQAKRTRGTVLLLLLGEMKIEPNLPLSPELYKTMWSMTKQNTVITHEDKMEIMVKSNNLKYFHPLTSTNHLGKIMHCTYSTDIVLSLKRAQSSFPMQ